MIVFLFMLFLFVMRIDMYQFCCSCNTKLYFVKAFSFVKINCTSVIGRKEGKRYKNDNKPTVTYLFLFLSLENKKLFLKKRKRAASKEILTNYA